MEQTKIFQAFHGIRGRKPVNLAALEALLVRFSRLVAEQRWIKEIDINPLLVSNERLIALDARIVLHDPALPDEELPAFAIRPYPIQYVQPWTMADGTAVCIRPIRPEDEPLMVKFHSTLSEQSVYLRYLQVLKLGTRVAHERLARLSFIDYDREMALVAEVEEAKTGECQIIGVGRLIKIHGTRDAEFAIIISDRYQRGGLGTELLRRLVQFGRDERLESIFAYMLPENIGMQRASEKIGFTLRPAEDGKLVRAEIRL
jgi:acetyltransferase